MTKQQDVTLICKHPKLVRVNLNSGRCLRFPGRDSEQTVNTSEMSSLELTEYLRQGFLVEKPVPLIAEVTEETKDFAEAETVIKAKKRKVEGNG